MKITTLVASAALALGMGTAVSPAVAADVEVLHWWTSGGEVKAVGNAAGTGAVQALLSRSLRAEMEQAVRDVVKIETALEPRFQELFVAAMAFPHASAPMPHVSAAVQLPESIEAGSAGTRGRRRRRGGTA